jgi:Phage portal protein, SPP1 Gp6-like
LSDWSVNFAFGKGVHFGVDKEYQHIVPALLERIWNTDNNKKQTLWEIGNQGSVQGDAFIKVAYEPGYVDAVGMPHPGRVRILPINAAFCFPEWHPHDRGRMVRFKLKYRFWGTAPEGTRQVYTYVEIITDDWIEEYVNDQLIDRRPNPLGEIPVVHIANKQASASPWGLSDVIDVIPLNRSYNELMTDIIDIINYHTAPVTIITGAKASNLEKGANKIWGLPSKDAKVENLDGGSAGLPQALEAATALKVAMHEMAAVPETALGQAQPISNTSGVALAIQYQPSMNAFEQKKTQYGYGFEQVNRIALRTLWTFEPETLQFNPETDGIYQGDQSGQVLVIDLNDPEAYHTETIWESPLPVDILVKLQEIQLMFALGLESKRGALKDLGEEFPDEKLQELFEEQIVDAQQAAARQILNAHIAAITMSLTGIVPEGAGEPVEQPKPGPDGKMPPKQKPPAGIAGALPSVEDILNGVDTSLFTDLVQQAFVPKMPMRRVVPDSKDDQ